MASIVVGLPNPKILEKRNIKYSESNAKIEHSGFEII
jgi:hypothetical protein